ncbi:MAG: hypothetical protein KF778_01265 [Rhodocyclaceae bacterium]|nr:hypothetical protein [Rhodocyclaceae bacterium]MBX3667005.1 hypothetical protein [Rhodocyclaceae bacterium]
MLLRISLIFFYCCVLSGCVQMPTYTEDWEKEKLRQKSSAEATARQSSLKLPENEQLAMEKYTHGIYLFRRTNRLKNEGREALEVFKSSVELGNGHGVWPWLSAMWLGQLYKTDDEISDSSYMVYSYFKVAFEHRNDVFQNFPEKDHPKNNAELNNIICTLMLFAVKPQYLTPQEAKGALSCWSEFYQNNQGLEAMVLKGRLYAEGRGGLKVSKDDAFRLMKAVITKYQSMLSAGSVTPRVYRGGIVGFGPYFGPPQYTDEEAGEHAYFWMRNAAREGYAPAAAWVKASSFKIKSVDRLFDRK